MADDAKALARRWYEELWNAHRVEALPRLMAAGCKGHLEGPPERREITGPEELRPFLDQVLGAFPDFHVSIEDVLGEGASAVVRWKATGTHRGDHLGVKATGRRVAFEGMTWMTFRDGQLVEGWDRWNLGQLLQELS